MEASEEECGEFAHTILVLHYHPALSWDMSFNNPAPRGPRRLEPLAQIVDRARAEHDIATKVSRRQLGSDLTRLYRDIFITEEPREQGPSTAWDMISEEFPTPTRRYKIFAKALNAEDPLATLITLSDGRSPSEYYLLERRIKTFARSRLPTIEKGLPGLKSAEWTELTEEQQSNIRKHMEHLNVYYYRTQKRISDPIENQINLAVHELAHIFAVHTHFDGLDTDLPYAATSRFVAFLCLAFAPFVHPAKLSEQAVSKRWRRLKGPPDIEPD